MKKLLSLLALSMLFASCAHVYFTEPQPAKGKRAMELPKELHGTWSTEGGTMEFHSKGITVMEIKQDTVENSTGTYKEYEYLNLSESFQLYTLKDLYVFNLKDDDSKFWEIGILQIQKNGDIHYYQNNEPESYMKDKGLKFIEAKYMDIESGEESTSKSLIPDTELQLQHVLFSGKVSYKTLKKALIGANLSTVYRKDGTMYSPGDEEEHDHDH